MRFLFALLLSSCLADSEVDVRGQWLHPEPSVKLLDSYMGSSDICLQFQTDGTLHVQSETDDEYLDYTYDEGVYDIQYIGRATFIQTPEGLDPSFSNSLIDNGTSDTLFYSCEPWRVSWYNY